MDFDQLQFICTTDKLSRLDYFISHIEYCENKTTAIVFYHKGRVYAYLNSCRHGERRLDCQADTVFDANGQLLSCSMHGCVFEPKTGTCLSPIGPGKRLQALKVIEKENGIYFADEQVRIIDPLGDVE